ncbi:hypothetical protein DNTS_033299 [Danionella cerebrum]|uniref:DUF4371 domain-containing protein n=1 Tax=Danionella cerebrum TaxID=2873325 RepID=A0A553NAN4_9TELE|nr:hypothetical protein DNTS_033299 [Danionella translucida]
MTLGWIYPTRHCSARLTLPQQQTLRCHRRPDDQVVGFIERVQESLQLLRSVHPGPQGHEYEDSSVPCITESVSRLRRTQRSSHLTLTEAPGSKLLILPALASRLHLSSLCQEWTHTQIALGFCIDPEWPLALIRDRSAVFRSVNIEPLSNKTLDLRRVNSASHATRLCRHTAGAGLNLLLSLVTQHKVNTGVFSHSPLCHAAPEESAKLRGIRMLEEHHEEALVELEGAGELPQDLPHRVQEEEEDGRFTAELPVGVCRLSTALLEGSWMQKTVAMGADGAAVNLGAKEGVSVKFQEEAGKHIIPFHCMPHRLELALLSAQKDSPWVGNVYSLLHIIWKTYHFSSKSRRELKCLGVELGVSVNNPSGVKGTRWLPHVSRALDVLLKQEKEGTLEDSGQYTAVYAHMDHLAASSTNADVAGRAKHFTQPALHTVRLIAAGLHQFDQTLLQNIRPVGEQASGYTPDQTMLLKLVPAGRNVAHWFPSVAELRASSPAGGREESLSNAAHTDLNEEVLKEQF